MICAIMQPTYFPWIGYFDLIDQVDKFIFLDNVKLEKSIWQVRKPYLISEWRDIIHYSNKNGKRTYENKYSYS